MEYKVGYKKPPPGFQPGQSGNPKGRPKDTFTEAIKEFYNESSEEKKQGIIKELHKLAMSHQARGQIKAIETILDRHDGRVPESKHISQEVKFIITHTTSPDALESTEKPVHLIPSVIIHEEANSGSNR